MKILHLRASNFYGGPERQLHLHSRHLDGSEYELTVGSFSEAGRTPEFLEVIASDGLATKTLPVKNAYDPSAPGQLREYLKANAVDILCTHDYRTHAVGWRARRGTRCRWIAFSRGWTSENRKIKLYHTLDKIIVRFADHIVAVSEAQKKRLTRLMVPDRKISVVHNAVDAAALRSVRPVNLHARFNLPRHAVVFVAGGRFSREKGQVFLVRAALGALQRDDRLRFVLFGDGPDLDSIRRLVSDSGNEQAIICPGFERNLLGCLAGADGLVNASLSEGLPNIVLEAMAVGTPVIATAVGGVPELITDGRDGLLVPPRDAASLRAKIVMLAADTDKARALADAAAETVEKNFTFAGQARRLTEVYKRTMTR